MDGERIERRRTSRMFQGRAHAQVENVVGSDSYFLQAVFATAACIAHLFVKGLLRLSMPAGIG